MRIRLWEERRVPQRADGNNMTVNIEYETDILLELAYEEIVNKVVCASASYEHCPYDAEVNVLFTDNVEIRKMNQEYRNIDRATDVLSFPMIAYDEPGVFSMVEDAVEDYFDPETGQLILGDIVISVEKVKEQARAYGHSEERELAFLTAHSMLHLFGYDHMDEEECLVMEKKQEEILNQLKIER